MYSANSLVVANVKMSGAPGDAASGAEITKPFTLIKMSSNVSAKTWFSASIADCNVRVSMPDAPIQSTSSVPIAVREIGAP